MGELQRAIDWLETGQYLVKHDESTYSVRETEFAAETDELRRALLDALRWVPVSERVPDEGEQIAFEPTSKYVQGGRYLHGKFKSANGTYPPSCVIRWMPIPPPPESNPPKQKDGL